jgi:hypothetical protein
VRWAPCHDAGGRRRWQGPFDVPILNDEIRSEVSDWR